MFKFYFVLAFAAVYRTADAAAKLHEASLRDALTAFLFRLHVQTVTTHTCWSCDADKKLLENLSANDVSASFHPSVGRPSTATWYRRAFLIDLSCAKSKSIFRQASNERSFNAQNDWLLFDRSPVTVQANATWSSAKLIFDTYLADAYVLPDSGVYLFQDVGRGIWEVWRGFRASKSGETRVFRTGTASSPDRSAVVLPSNGERSDFRGTTLRANTVIVEREKFFGFHNKTSSDLDVFSHIHYEMTVILSRQLNFEIALTVDGEYGWSDGNGTFGGLIGILQRDEIDLSAAGVLFRADRVSAVDYTVGTMAFRTTAMFRQPSLSSAHNILLLPFTFELWSTVMALSVAFVLVIVFLTRAIRTIKRDNGDNGDWTMNAREIITLVNGALCQQGVYYRSDFEAIRIAVAVLFMTSSFLFTSYSASIAALLQSNSNSIKTIGDILESTMTFNAQISPYGKYYFEETENPLIATLYRTKMLPNGNKAFTKATEGMDKTRTEFHGFMTEVISAYKIINEEWREEEKCGLGEIQLFQFPPLSIPLVKNSGHRDIFKQKLIHQLETGLVKRITNQWIAPKPSCGWSGRTNIYVSVSIRDISLALHVIGIGVCISSGIVVIEIVHHYWTNQKINDNSRCSTQ